MTPATLRERLPLAGRMSRGAVHRPGGCWWPAARDLPKAAGAPGGWQLPHGGIDAGEDPAAAVLRELAEEIGTARPRSSASTRAGDL